MLSSYPLPEKTVKFYLKKKKSLLTSEAIFLNNKQGFFFIFAITVVCKDQ